MSFLRMSWMGTELETDLLMLELVLFLLGMYLLKLHLNTIILPYTVRFLCLQ
jgi:hypothetical protein